MRKKKAWNMSNPLFRYLHGGGRKVKRSRRKGETMARRRSFGGRSSSGGMNKWLKVAAFAIGGAMIAPRLGFDGKLGAAAGGFFAGGPIGAVAGYVGAPYAMNALGGAGVATQNNTVIV